MLQVRREATHSHFYRHDETAVHFLLRLNDELGTPVGTIRCYDSTEIDLTDSDDDRQECAENGSKRSCRAYRLSRLVVLPMFRKYGYGRALVEGLHTWVKQQVVRDELVFAKVILWSQVQAIPFYTRCVDIMECIFRFTLVDWTKILPD